MATTNAPLTLEVVHQTQYEYRSPVSLAHHLAHLQPLADAAQQPLAFEVHIDPEPGHRRDSIDSFGNPQCHFSLPRAHEALLVRATSRVRVWPRFERLDSAASEPWEAVAAALRYEALAPAHPATEYTAPSPFVPRLAALRHFAAPCLLPGHPVAEVALALMQRIHAGLRYEARSTEVDTPLAQVLVDKRGVCQDFAHLMIGALRMAGLAARYVSGYLLTSAPEDGRAMVGADASHAWVQVWAPGAVPGAGLGDAWLDFDPTNNCIPGAGHVRLAVGRDYGDVTPLRGVIRGGGRHTLAVAVRTRVLAQD